MGNCESSNWFRKWVHWPFAESLEERKRGTEWIPWGLNLKGTLSSPPYFRNKIVVVIIRKFYKLALQTFLFLANCMYNWFTEWAGLSQGWKSNFPLFLHCSFKPPLSKCSPSLDEILGWDPRFPGHVCVLKSSVSSNVKILCSHLIQSFCPAPTPLLHPRAWIKLASPKWERPAWLCVAWGGGVFPS